MKIFPDYYKSFCCIADRCKHNCCIGWEIDIDSDTLAFYEGLTTVLGEAIKSSIDYDETPHFRLSDDDRCPHLDERGLCRIISEAGETGICEICREHPRFRNFYGVVEEIGLGPCCEEACRLILTKNESVTLVSDEGEIDTSLMTDDEKNFFNLRSRSFDLLQNRNASIDERIAVLLDLWETDLPDMETSTWADILLSLERLDDRWGEMLEGLKNSPYEHLDKVNVILPAHSAEQLLAYFLYRHLTGALEDGSYKSRVRLCVVLFCVVRALYALLEGETDASLDTVCEVARMLSSEIEYSEDNLDELLFELSF